MGSRRRSPARTTARAAHPRRLTQRPPTPSRAHARANPIPGGSMTPTPAHNGPYSELTADAARDLRRPISPDEVRFKVQAVRWTKRDGSDRVATAAQVVA